MKKAILVGLVALLVICFFGGTLIYQAGKNTSEYKIREKELAFNKEKERQRRIELIESRKIDKEKQREKESEKRRLQTEESLRESKRRSEESSEKRQAMIKKLIDDMARRQTSGLTPPRQPMPPLPPLSRKQVSTLFDNSFANLDDVVIIADDGTFLGEVSNNPIAPKSISNATGSYGSLIGTKSIFNNIGKYGSDISPHSPWNNLATSPPRVFQFIGYLTTNELKSPRIDSYALVEYLETQH